MSRKKGEPTMHSENIKLIVKQKSSEEPKK